LRKMKTQIELTDNYAKKYNEDQKNVFKKDYEEDWRMRQYYNKYPGSYKYCLEQECIYPKYVLIIKDYNSTTTTKEQLITIFNQSFINIVFINELFDTLPEQIIKENLVKPQIIDTKIQNDTLKLVEENKSLRESLLQSEEKIKQLQEEIESLKIQKQSKTIKDYFKKKIVE
jgi:hypothetical protein